MGWNGVCLKKLKQITDDDNDYWVVCAWCDGMGWDGAWISISV